MRGVLAIALLMVAAVASAAVALASGSPRDVRASIVAAALAKSSVHVKSLVSVSWPPSHGFSERSAVDVTTDSGQAAVTVYGENDKRDGNVHLRLVNDVVYVRGDRAAIVAGLGWTSALLKSYVDHWQWFSIPKGDPRYATPARGLTLASFVHSVTPRGSLTLSRQLYPAKNHRVIRLLVVQGDTSLAARARGNRLPVAFWEPGIHVSYSGSFSRWNEPVRVEAPAHSTPIATGRSG